MTTPSVPSEDELDVLRRVGGLAGVINPTQALALALSVQAETMLIGEARDRAPAMLAHLQAMGYDVVPVAAARSAPAGLDVEALVGLYVLAAEIEPVPEQQDHVVVNREDFELLLRVGRAATRVGLGQELPCPMRSSLTDEPCVLLWGHPADSSMRFHKFAAALAAEEVR